MSIHELDIVELTEDIPEHGLRRGEQGAVVFAFSGGAYEVEFVNEDGETRAMVPLTADQLRVVQSYADDVTQRVAR